MQWTLEKTARKNIPSNLWELNLFATAMPQATYFSKPTQNFCLKSMEYYIFLVKIAFLQKKFNLINFY